MIIVALPASLCLSPSPPSRAGAGMRCPHDLHRLSPAAAPIPAARILAPKKRVVFAPDENTGPPPPPPPHGRSVRDPKIPIGPAKPNRATSFPRFPPYQAFGRRPAPSPSAPAKGRPPKPFSQADIADCSPSVAIGRKARLPVPHRAIAVPAKASTLLRSLRRRARTSLSSNATI